MVIFSKKYLKFMGLALLLTALFSCGKGPGTPNMATTGTSNTNTNGADSTGGGNQSHDKPIIPSSPYEPPVGNFYYTNPKSKNSTFIFDSSAMTTITPIKAGWDVKPNNFYEDPLEVIKDPKTNLMVPKLTYFGLNLDSSGTIQGTPTTSFDEHFKIFAKNDGNKTDPIPNATIHIIYANSRGLTFNLVNPILDNSKNISISTYTITNPNPEIPIQITSIKTDVTVDPYPVTAEKFNPDYSSKTGCTNHVLNSATPSCQFIVSYLDKTSTNKNNYAFILTTSDAVYNKNTYSVGTDVHSVPQITAQNTTAHCPSGDELSHLDPLYWTSDTGTYSSELSFTSASWGGEYLINISNPGTVYCHYGSILGYIIKSVHTYVSPTPATDPNWSFGTITLPPPPVCHEGMYGIKICVPGTGPGTTQTITSFSSCTSSDPNACQFQPTPS